MHYLLNKNLSLEAKGVMAILLYLNEGGIKLTGKTIRRYCIHSMLEYDYFSVLMSLHLSNYIDICDDEDYVCITTVREDNEIKE